MDAARHSAARGRCASQQVTGPGGRVAILAPPGIDYIVGFFAAIHAGNIAVPLFAPQLPGHAERLDAVLSDPEPAVVLTTTAAAESVGAFLRNLPRSRRPRMIAVDAVPDSVGDGFVPAALDTDDIAYLQYTSGSTRTPAGVEITHRSVCTNVLQMIISVGLQPGGVRPPPVSLDQRAWRIEASDLRRRTQLRVRARRPARPSACRGDARPEQHGGLINGSEPVSMASIDKFNAAFAPYGFSPTAINPSYGMAEATLLVSTIAPGAQPVAVHPDRQQLGAGRAVRVSADAPNAVAATSCNRGWTTAATPRAPRSVGCRSAPATSRCTWTESSTSPAASTAASWLVARAGPSIWQASSRTRGGTRLPGPTPGAPP